MTRTHNTAETRKKLLDAARDVIRAKGYEAATVDEICAAAGVTKGGFFHHFASKEQLGVAAIEAFDAMAQSLFGSAPYQAYPDPRDRVLGYVDLRAAMMQGDIAGFSCLMGTTVQETYATHPLLRAACEDGMSGHVAMLARDIEAAKRLYAPDASWSAESVGYFMQAALQGAFIFAKAKHSPELARECLGHLRRYLETILGQPATKSIWGDAVMTKSQVKPIPDGMHTVTPHLVVAGAADALAFYAKAFGAVELSRLPGPQGKLMHSAFRIGDSVIMMSDEIPDFGSLGPKALKGSSVYIHLYVDNVDDFVARAVAAGAKVTMPVSDMFWGDRYGQLEDPFGHRWSIGTHMRDVTSDEMREAMQNMSARRPAT
jgi:uncharacterized glyoxalase superfamily protein PhnB/AcrR family transcriptional regulator